MFSEKKSSRGYNIPITLLKENIALSIQTSANSGPEMSDPETGTRKTLLCRTCKKGLSYNSHRATCNKCQADFHFKCIKNTKMPSLLKSWLCDFCSSALDLQRKKSDSAESVTTIDIIVEMPNVKQEIVKANSELTLLGVLITAEK